MLIYSARDHTIQVIILLKAVFTPVVGLTGRGKKANTSNG